MATEHSREPPALHEATGLDALRARLEERGTVGARVAEAIRFRPREIVVLALLALVVLAGAGLAYVRARPASAASIAPVGAPAIPTDAAAPSPTPDPIVVHVVGAVRHPGVYRFAEGARVVDAVRAAGGFSSRADRAAVNLARLLVDGEQIVVARRGPHGAVAPKGGAETGGLVNLNSATVADLDGLPGIGPVLAQRIIDYRDQHGPFRSPQDLDKVSGIGPATLQDLLPLVTV
jgi:competence protein ComEA